MTCGHCNGSTWEHMIEIRERVLVDDRRISAVTALRAYPLNGTQEDHEAAFRCTPQQTAYEVVRPCQICRRDYVPTPNEVGVRAHG